MKKFRILLGIVFLSVFFAVTSGHAAWTIASVDIDDQFAGKVGDTPFLYIKAMLTGDGAAETDLDLWTELQATIDSTQKKLLSTGGILQSIVYQQGAQAPDNDFLLTIYNGTGASVFSETIDYDEAGSGSIVGGTYDASTSKGFFPPIANGLVVDVADIGGASDKIILWFVVVVGN